MPTKKKRGWCYFPLVWGDQLQSGIDGQTPHDLHPAMMVGDCYCDRSLLHFPSKYPRSCRSRFFFRCAEEVTVDTFERMDNLEPVSKISPDELPEGFTATDPNAGRHQARQHQQSQQQQSQQQRSQQQQMEAQKQALLEQALTPEALARLRRIKLVKEKRAVALENALASMALSGKLPGPVNEGKLIEMLERGSASSESAQDKRISIQRKKYAFDSDDDDDNDDDLL
jgi:programmed cell death protein 5